MGGLPLVHRLLNGVIKSTTQKARTGFPLRLGIAISQPTLLLLACPARLLRLTRRQ